MRSMAMRVLVLISCLAITSLASANQYCMTYPDGTVICSNPDGSWG